MPADAPCPPFFPNRADNVPKYMEETAAAVGRLGHDFGNVLTGILGFAELALAQLVPGTLAYRYVQEVVRSAQPGVRMVEGLARFNRCRPCLGHSGERSEARAREPARAAAPESAHDLLSEPVLPNRLPNSLGGQRADS